VGISLFEWQPCPRYSLRPKGMGHADALLYQDRDCHSVEPLRSRGCVLELLAIVRP